MNFKQTMKYQMRDFIRTTLIYYLVIALIFVASLIVTALVLDGGIHGAFSLGGSAAIFLFVLGLNAFKSNFYMYIQNGISRRTQLVTFFVSAVCLCLVMTIIDSLYPILFGKILQYESTYQNIYSAFGIKSGFISYVWMFTSYLAAMCFGYFLTTLYYRMSKPVKVLVSVGVPVLLFVVLPVIEVFVPSFNLFTSLMKFAAWAMGLDLNGFRVFPWRAVGSFAVISVLMMGLSYLLTRRATLKEG